MPNGRSIAVRIFVLLVVCLAAVSLPAQEARWKELSARVDELVTKGKYEEALPLAQEETQVAEKSFGPEDPHVAQSLDDLGEILHQLGRLDESTKALQRALAIDEKALGKEHPDVARILQSLGMLYRDENQFPESDAAFQRAIAIREKALGAEDPLVAETLSNLAVNEDQEGRYKDSEAHFQRALAIREKKLGKEDPAVADTLHNFGFLYLDLGRYPEAEAAFRRALEIRKKTLGEEHPDVGDTTSSLALTLADEGRFAEAEPLYLRALAIREKAFGPDHPDVATTCVNLAQLYDRQSRFAEAERLYQRALAIYEKVLGPEHIYVAITSMALGDLYASEGKYGGAEAAYQRALSIQEKTLGKEHANVAANLDLLGKVYTAEGRYAEAEALFQRAISIYEKVLGKDHPDLASTLGSLAILYWTEKKYEPAKALVERALAIQQKAMGPEHPNVAIDYNNLGELAKDTGHPADAEAYFRRALAIMEKDFGKDNPGITTSLTNLGDLYSGQGRYGEAEPVLERALAIDERGLGPDHPTVAKDLGVLASMYYGSGRPQQAGAAYDQLLANLSHRFQYYFSYMTEKQRLQFTDTVAGYFPAYFSFCLSYHEKDPALAGKMYDVLLWQKGFVGQSIAALRSRIAASGDPQALALLEKLSIKKTQLATLLGASAEEREKRKAEIQQLEQETSELEKQLVQHSSALAEEKKLERVTWQDVRAALKPGEAAVELVRFHFFDGKKWTPTYYYAALIVSARTVAAPQFVLLGEAQKLEAGPVAEYRNRTRREPLPPARGQLSTYAGFWKPLQPALGTLRRVYLSPDGALNQLSLGLAPAPGGQLLMQRYDLRLVSSTKDVLRPAAASAAAERSAVLIGDPKFDLTPAEYRAELKDLSTPQAAPVLVAALAPGNMSRDREAPKCPLPGTGVLCPLPGTEAELKSVDGLLAQHHWQVEVFRGGKALEEALKEVKHPRLLHLATHGFFLPDQERGGRSAPGPSGSEDPMLRSGLFFAGADQALSGAPASSDTDDGVLTAYEASGLDLEGTELVVLSACNTGQGEVKNGEGVFGLRRALQEAGAQAILMSLWPVPDQETQELMSLFYKRWLGGMEKHEALRQAQLEMRAVTRKRYGRDLPYYWGAFVLVGR